MARRSKRPAPLKSGRADKSVVSRMQRGIERLYRVDTNLDVDAFLVGERARNDVLGEHQHDAAGNARRPAEQLLVAYEDGALDVALFIDAAVIEHLERHDPALDLNDDNFGSFCVALEGVSHFVYAVLRAQAERPVSALELELQAEVDKFVSCVLLQDTAAARGGALGERLYERIRFAADLGPEERARYKTANQQARQYAAWLDRRFLQQGRLRDMLVEVRAFYRMNLNRKLGHIAAAA